MIYYYNYKSPIGGLLIAKNQNGVIKIAINQKVVQFLMEVEILTRDRAKESYNEIKDVINEMDLYFNKELENFLIKVDLIKLSEFQRDVLNFLQMIPYGITMSYKVVAMLIGKPEAARAVGQVCRRNPVPIIIPCHRVIKNDGELGGYTGSLKAKKYLLKLEGNLV